MDEFENINDLFRYQLRDLYSAETQLIDALPGLQRQASNRHLQAAIGNHLEETKNHKSRLQEIARSLELDLSGETCKPIESLIDEAQTFTVSKDAAENVRDADLIADAHRIEHYEIAAYGIALQYAEALGYSPATGKLQQTLDEEKAADRELTEIAKEYINPQAETRL